MLHVPRYEGHFFRIKMYVFSMNSVHTLKPTTKASTNTGSSYRSVHEYVTIISGGIPTFPAGGSPPIMCPELLAAAATATANQAEFAMLL